jgi:hypothetical protein
MPYPQPSPPNAQPNRRSLLQAAVAGAATTLGGRMPRAFGEETPPALTRPAKHVIVLYMSGGFSHVDTFDPKSRLLRDHDLSIGPPVNAAPNQPQADRFLKAPGWRFHPNRQAGTEVSDLFPHLRQVMHEVALIRSMHSDHRDHGEATLQLHTGSTNTPMPSLGSWLSYGLGTENSQLPGHVVISEHRPYNGPQICDPRPPRRCNHWNWGCSSRSIGGICSSATTPLVYKGGCRRFVPPKGYRNWHPKS